MSSIVTPPDIATYLGLDAVDDARAQMLIDDAISQALSIATVGTIPDTGVTEANLPTGAASVIRPAVARIYLNPTGVTSEAAGTFNYSRPATSGSMFSKAERKQLRRLAGQAAGAFTIDPTPVDAMTGFVDPLAGPTSADELEFLEELGL